MEIGSADSLGVSKNFGEEFLMGNRIESSCPKRYID
jgi:hypothetical protein